MPLHSFGGFSDVLVPPLLLNYIISEVLPPLLMGSALASNGSILELARISSIRHRGSF